MHRSLLLIGVLSLSSCGPPPQTAPQKPPTPDELFEQVMRRAAELNSLTNLYPDEAPASPSIPPADLRVAADSLELQDLGLAFRRISMNTASGGESDLFVGDTEVTNRAYSLFLGDTGQTRDDTALLQACRQDFRIHCTALPLIRAGNDAFLWKEGRYPDGHDDHPVTFVTTSDAMEFCHWLDSRYATSGQFRLPTEDEWLFAAYGVDRQYPWGDEWRSYMSKSTTSVKVHPELCTPDGLYGMWGNVSELVLSPATGYGGRMLDPRNPMITCWLGEPWEMSEIHGKRTGPRQDYWGYTHARNSRCDEWGFRVVWVPSRTGSSGESGT